jgi:hypothetical protein
VKSGTYRPSVLSNFLPKWTEKWTNISEKTHTQLEVCTCTDTRSLVHFFKFLKTTILISSHRVTTNTSRGKYYNSIPLGTWDCTRGAYLWLGGLGRFLPNFHQHITLVPKLGSCQLSHLPSINRKQT